MNRKELFQLLTHYPILSSGVLQKKENGPFFVVVVEFFLRVAVSYHVEMKECVSLIQQNRRDSLSSLSQAKLDPHPQK